MQEVQIPNNFFSDFFREIQSYSGLKVEFNEQAHIDASYEEKHCLPGKNKTVAFTGRY